MAGYITNDQNGWTVVSKKIILPQGSRRLRHLQSILVRNMDHKGKLLTTYCKLFKGDEVDGEELFKTETVEGTLNPMWGELPEVMKDGRNVNDVRETAFTVVVCEENDEEVMRCTVNFKMIELVAQAVGELAYINDPCVFFEFHDGVFISTSPDKLDLSAISSPSLHQDYESCSLEVDYSLKDTREPSDQTVPQSIADIKYSVTRMVALAYALQASEENVTSLQSTISSILEKQEVHRAKCIEKEHRQSHIMDLRLKIEATRERLKQKQTELIKKREATARESASVSQAVERIREKQESQKEAHDQKLELKNNMVMAEMQIQSRKQQLVASLRAIFPIEIKKGTDTWTICGMQLSSGTAQALDDEAATALGYVAHCIQLLSKIWGVPLRYPVYPIASRSYIHEQVLETIKPELYPLFCARGSDKQKYNKATILLDRNLRQLLQVRGLGMLKPKHMLHNLNHLFDSNPDINSYDEDD